MLISYAQNFEDVILWRALKHIDRGFYVDVGAQDPVKDSVSLSFYEAGWRGVHVEPSPHYAAKLRAARPDEEVIGAAISRNSGLITFYESVGTGLSTCDPILVERHTADGFEFHEISAPCVTLSDVLDGCRGREIHWLKIDVEGFEHSAIDSWLPSTARPWVVVVESVRPGTHEPSFADWEPTLLGLGYAFVYFDGLNRFYLSEQHPELAVAFGAGPNVFDGFVLSGENSNTFALKLDHAIANQREAEHQLKTKIAQLELETRTLQQQLAEANRAGVAAREQLELEARAFQVELAEAARASAAARQQLEARIAELDANARRSLQAVTNLQLEVAGLRGSASWRITAPLRWVHSKSVARLPAARTLPGVALARLSRHRNVTRCGRFLIRPFPRLRTRLEALLSAHQSPMNGAGAPLATHSVSAGDPAGPPLSRSARFVYEQLKAARRK